MLLCTDATAPHLCPTDLGVQIFRAVYQGRHTLATATAQAKGPL